MILAPLKGLLFGYLGGHSSLPISPLQPVFCKQGPSHLAGCRCERCETRVGFGLKGCNGQKDTPACRFQVWDIASVVFMDLLVLSSGVQTPISSVGPYLSFCGLPWFALHADI